jgi:hypothetical protein
VVEVVVRLILIQHLRAVLAVAVVLLTMVKQVHQTKVMQAVMELLVVMLLVAVVVLEPQEAMEPVVKVVMAVTELPHLFQVHLSHTLVEVEVQVAHLVLLQLELVELAVVEQVVITVHQLHLDSMQLLVRPIQAVVVEAVLLTPIAVTLRLAAQALSLFDIARYKGDLNAN